MSFAEQDIEQYDVVVVGAGFSGLYMLHRLRALGYSVRVYEAGDDVGGTWYWNRYPGARCDIESIYYNYTFSEEILNEWTWSSRYAEQPEILRYIHFVVEKLDLRKDIQFKTRITAAHYNENNHRWEIDTNHSTQLVATYFITAIGCLSASNIPKYPGMERFQGALYHTGRWPHEKVDFTGKRVGVIGTGSSGIQAIPVIAKEAQHLTVFQRTPQYSVPAHNHPYNPEFLRQMRENYSEIKQLMNASMHGVPFFPRDRATFQDTSQVQQEVYEDAWQQGGLFTMLYTYNDLAFTEQANATVAEFIRAKIHKTVRQPEVAKKLMPTYYFGTKRPILDTEYFETYNRKNVSLVDLQTSPIEEIIPTGLRTSEASYELDILVFATGFDAITGPLLNMDIRGKNGVSLKEKWAGGANLKTYLGIATAGFPNLFMITGPQSPSVLSNMLVSIEQHVEWIADCIEYLRQQNMQTIEANVAAEELWTQQCKALADMTLLSKTDSWYMGANIEGKPRGFLAFVGGVGLYRQICKDVATKGYEGFSISQAKPPLDAQAQLVIEQIKALGAPALETLSPEEARRLTDFPTFAGVSEEVGCIENRTIPGPHGDIPIRIYIPKGMGPYPVLVYYHGGGWVVGNLDTADEPCRYLAHHANCVVVSVDYRLAPEHKFPTAAEDAYAAVKWVADHAQSMQIDAKRIAIGGDSAGGNLAAVVALMAKDKGGPTLAYQILIYPVTHHSFDTISYQENAEGYRLTKNAMVWFWDQYLCTVADGKNPYASPLLAEDLSGLPPALVLTAGYDPLRDEGEAYAHRLKAAGVPVELTRYDGMIHGFFLMSGALDQGKMAIDQVAKTLQTAFYAVETSRTP